MNIVDWVIHVMDGAGAIGVFAMLFLENIFPPIPSEVVLPLAGVASGRGAMTFWAVLVAALVANVVGAWVLYGVGYFFGAERVRWLCGKVPLLEVEDFDKSAAWFEKHGSKGIFFGRMVPGIRAIISVPAGVYKMNWLSFTVLTAVGSTIWNSLFIILGYKLGENWKVIEPYTDLISKIIYVIVIVLVVWFVVHRVVRNRRRRRVGQTMQRVGASSTTEAGADAPLGGGRAIPATGDASDPEPEGTDA